MMYRLKALPWVDWRVFTSRLRACACTAGENLVKMSWNRNEKHAANPKLSQLSYIMQRSRTPNNEIEIQKTMLGIIIIQITTYNGVKNCALSLKEWINK